MDEQTPQRGDIVLQADSAHAWIIPLDISMLEMDAFSETLSPSESRRADAFHFDVDRFRFIAGRGALRTILGRYLNESPVYIEFEYEPRGKPRLAGQFASGDLQFNLAHCEDVAVLALAWGCSVGIDVERERDFDDIEPVVKVICSPRQVAEFEALRSDQQTAAFYRLWTRKEAWLKATGNGITTSLEEVEPSFLPGETAHYQSLPKSFSTPVNNWSLFDFMPKPGFIAALALDKEIEHLEVGRRVEQRTLEASYV
ncbi:MAG TPA: 4'-phosphopantetheinyl transferase superfamily protein [Verrucomicrobiae bacterium]|jgi:4'-phosphopantetheinyl transferase